ncbi:hypothetical protein BCR36DRAFT_581966 [Piromyces finnis]|uniref:N-acetyltransferase domain-containing protein n=1 Tax=Piromyces finnis TaxID=1754191 RepID=A0A1Y1VEQ8_9FUNG|nr:hypothetical protein BCR36DRAFT_581966 [Piromyces finnis]|eukprot:ORX54334.1 hypothetical protein BCR36DRAFT_581966 [Piromyces finnis]
MEAFTPDERAPYWILKRRVLQGKAEQWNFFDKKTWLGWIYFSRYKDLIYIFFFAIDAKWRGQGYGTKALKAFIEKNKGHRIFLALEDWTKDSMTGNKEQRIKRYNFYKNCGLAVLPHHLKEGINIFAIMGVGGPVEAIEYKELMNDYIGWPFKYFIDMRMVD